MVSIPDEGLRLNVGCGRHTLDGWFCIDAVQHPKATRTVDLLSDAKKIDLPENCARELMAIHVFEHFYRWESEELLVEWGRLLRSGGLLVLEMPDLIKFCHNVLSGKKGNHPDQLTLWAMYGDPRPQDPYMCHRWGWTFSSIKPLLQQYGFYDIKEEQPQWHPNGKGVRDFRVTARKA